MINKDFAEKQTNKAQIKLQNIKNVVAFFFNFLSFLLCYIIDVILLLGVYVCMCECHQSAIYSSLFLLVDLILCYFCFPSMEKYEMNGINKNNDNGTIISTKSVEAATSVAIETQKIVNNNMKISRINKNIFRFFFVHFFVFIYAINFQNFNKKKKHNK